MNSAPYRWEEDWPRITIEWPEIGRDESDGIVSRAVFAKTPKCYFQQDAATPRTEIPFAEYERIGAVWEARRKRTASEPLPHKGNEGGEK